jgi:hypothetical protein
MPYIPTTVLSTGIDQTKVKIQPRMLVCASKAYRETKSVIANAMKNGRGDGHLANALFAVLMDRCLTSIP